ncbi:hypothetical protein GEO21_22360 [Sphingobacterium faecium]|uniref:hypothetical protein n=1 Tax=Sphingobacterium faecium TaxID=34087 RepID=UPI001292B784|nr:hypothetical protein [Sphingobacterium faecium]MQP30231.1 hypothetical protein [Sphingobacterium faecium]
MAQESDEIKKEFNRVHGWKLLVKNVSDYTNTPFFQLMEMSCMEIFSVASMMIDESEMNVLQSNNKGDSY